ncbi:Aste57867_3690 [Aphanomyces stellatus]|uniref:Aste57867_3690 protein n=1 Tax=Aphanomyces stellatus TaxID=120398 RepID=A0A485KE28_9STRA|nr:hypothetical protein As57867_003679 [Aphanomyces stellatus]VFT80845.1 Aste57867_3690 [Aphanomyces stellatus]
MSGDGDRLPTRASSVSTRGNDPVVREDEANLLFKSIDTCHHTGVPDLWHPSHIGLMITYAGVGVLHGAFPRTVYPYFRMFLNMDGYQVTACASIIDMAWSFKIFFGLLSDGVPICGYRRRPYVLLGWLICLAFLVVMATLPPAMPYFAKGEILGVADVRARRIDNPHAAADGTPYILYMMAASMGYVMADVACDAAMVELAQTEREDVRGHTQSWSYIVKSTSASVTTGLVGFALNGAEYGGAFTWSMSFNALMSCLCLVVLAVLPAVWFFPDRRAPLDAPPLTTKLGEMYDICAQRAIWQTMWFHYSNTFFSDFGAAPSSVVASDWAKVEPINDSIFSMLSSALMAFGMCLTNWYFLDVDWRVIVVVTTLSYVVLDAAVSFLTIYAVVRNQWFYLGAPVLNSIPAGVRFVVTGFVIVEVADMGHEGATYGLVTTVGNLASPLAASISKVIDGSFQAYQADIDRDTPAVRDQVAYTFGIMYLMKLMSLITLVLLPAQKREARALKRDGGTYPWIGFWTLVVTGASLVFGVVTNLFTIFPSTKCLRLAGGPGCHRANNGTTRERGWLEWDV